MKRIYVWLLLLVSTAASAQEKKLFSETPEQKEKRMAWWTNDRFGMFIHWGLYALPARHEWIKNREMITDADYQKYFDNFNPDLYDPRGMGEDGKGCRDEICGAHH
ncbi:alpha-L-fucosidase [Chitinophaga sedimenti]|uniref:alpha-L-fucosidase n=1 Tax=Chitinophaga sedimenti TaxID=2033606 RepID=UPI002004D7E5|nr:alpha-L-fucosidase [Chitinophaga sedimenti]MCK7557448.1 alpha-L-fucosidase [Chitinophaga sedimenti]